MKNILAKILISSFRVSFIYHLATIFRDKPKRLSIKQGKKNPKKEKYNYPKDILKIEDYQVIHFFPKNKEYTSPIFGIAGFVIISGIIFIIFRKNKKQLYI